MKYVIIFISIFLISSCSHQSKKMDSDKQDFDGHLLPSTKPVAVAPIPQLASTRVKNPPPQAEVNQKLFTLSAIEAPVHEVLFRLGEMAKFDVDIERGVQGTITINAVQQTLSSILSRISAQLNLVVGINENTITVKQDRAYWQEYAIDYVNIKRTSQNTIAMNMTVGGAVNPQTGAGAGSSSTVQVTSEHDFWLVLKNSLQLIVNQDSSIQTGSLGLDGEQAATVRASAESIEAVVANPEAGIVLVYAKQSQHLHIRQYIDSVMQRSERQVMIEASVVEVSLSNSYQSGIDWNLTGFGNVLATAVGSGTVTTGVSTNLGADFGFGIKALEKFGDVQVLSSPRIMAVNNQAALLKVVDNEVYFTIDVSRSTSSAGTDTTYSTTVHTVPVGFMMTVTPFVANDNQITLNVRPTISRIIGRVRDPNPDLRAVSVDSYIPIVQEREMETVLRLRNNQTAVIGGLIEDREDRLDQGLPWLARIPFLGRTLFGNRERGTHKTELVVFIRPVIVDKPDIEKGDLKHYRSLLEDREFLK